jgi:hypothetical protein
MVSPRFPRSNQHVIPPWRSELTEALEACMSSIRRGSRRVKIPRGQLALAIIDRRQTRAEEIALIRRRLNGFELRQAAREERRRRRRPGAKRETRQMSVLESAGE